MAHIAAITQASQNGLKRQIFSRVSAVVLAVMLWGAQPQVAQADEVEDMLARLAALSAGQSASGAAVTNIVGVDGIHGAAVSGSNNGSQGIMALNQDAGPGGATQANVVVIALSSGPDASAIARLLAEQTYINETQASPTGTPVLTYLAALAIVDSYRGGAGIAQVNQSAGEGNIQRNTTLIAAALGGGDALALSEADLSSLGSANGIATGGEGQRGATSISGSFTDFSGIAQVNQTIGRGNVVSNSVSFTYAGAPAGGG